MDVADQFQEIRVFFADDGFVSILKEVTRAFVSFVEGDGIAGHEAAHDFAEWGRACTQKEVKVIRDQGPGVTLGLGFFQDDCQAIEEGVAVLVLSEKLPTFNSPGHDVLQEAGGVKSGLARHLFFRQYLQDDQDFFVVFEVAVIQGLQVQTQTFLICSSS